MRSKLKITKDQVHYLKTHYQEYSDAKLGKALNESKNWVYLALTALKLQRSAQHRAAIQRNAKKTPPKFVEKTNIPHIVPGENLPSQSRYLLFTVLAVIAIVYISLIPDFPAGTYGAELSVCATDFGLPSSASPLYICIANAFCYFDIFASPAWQLQLLSAICTVITCGVIAVIFYRLLHCFSWAMLLMLLFAFSINTWENAITTSPIAMAMMFFSICLYFCISWYETPQEHKIIVIVLSLIAAIATHAFFLIFTPGVLLFLFIAYRDYKFAKETIFSTVILLFLGLNIFLIIPFASWNHNAQNAPQGFVDTLQFVLTPVGQFETFSLAQLSTFSSGVCGFTTQNILLGIACLIGIMMISFCAIRRIHESKPALANLFLSIALAYFFVFITLAFSKNSHDVTIAMRYLSLPLFIVIGIFVGQLFTENKLAYVACSLILIVQLFLNPVSNIHDKFIHTYSQHVLKSVPPGATIVADNNIYWSLVYNNKHPQTKILLAHNEKRKQQLIRQNSNAYLTYVDFAKYTRFFRNGLLWHTQKNTQDVPQWSTTTKVKNESQLNLVSQYHLTNAMHFMEKNDTPEVLRHVAKAKEHQQHALKLLARYAQQVAAKRKYDDVLSIYKYLQNLFPNNPNYIVATARVKNIEGKIEEAEKHYKDAIQLSPKHFYANIELAKIYETTKRLQQAQKIYESMIKFYPENAYAYKKLAQIYSQSEQTQSQAAKMHNKGQELEKKQAAKNTATPNQPKIPNPNNILPQLPQIPKPQDFYPKIPNPIPGRKQK